MAKRGIGKPHDEGYSASDSNRIVAGIYGIYEAVVVLSLAFAS